MGIVFKGVNYTNFLFTNNETWLMRLIIVLTHWGQDKVAAIWRMTPSNAFSSMKMFELWIKFYQSLFLRVQLVIIGSDNGLAPSRRQAIIWTNDGLIYWHKYASVSLNELSCGCVPQFDPIIIQTDSNSHLIRTHRTTGIFKSLKILHAFFKKKMYQTSAIKKMIYFHLIKSV